MTSEEKDQIAKSIVDRVTSALEEGKIKEADIPEIGNFVMENIEKVESQDQLIGFLNILSMKWPIFSNLSLQTEGKFKTQIEKKVVQNMGELIKSGKIDQAINLAKTLDN